MLDFAALPPEINSGLMYAGPGAGPMLAVAAAWDVLGAELDSTASSYHSVIVDLTSVWLGPSSMMMAAAAAPYVAWITATAGQALTTGAQAKVAVAAYEAAFAMTVPPPVIAANRALLLLLIATNFFGQNTPAIMATEAHYMEMWAQDAAAMYGYQAAAQAASTFAPFTPPVVNTNVGGVSAQAAAVDQSSAASAGTGVQTVSSLTAAAPNAVSGPAVSTISSSSTSPLSSWSTLSSSSTALTSGASLASGAGSSVSMSSSGMSATGLASSLMRSVGPTVGALGNQALGSAFGNGLGLGTGAFGAPSMGSAAVTAGAGRAASVGMLSVPQGWASAAPAFNQVGSALPGAGASATTAVLPGGPGGMTGGMPMLANAARGMSGPPAATAKLGFQPAVVQRPVYAG